MTSDRCLNVAFFLQVFIGNTDRNKAVYNWFSSEIIARFVKIKVHDKNGNACMRVKILGCDEGRHLCCHILIISYCCIV